MELLSPIPVSVDSIQAIIGVLFLFLIQMFI